MFNDYDDILTVEELLEILQIGRNTAYYLLGTGQIKSVRIGKKYRIPREFVIEYILQKCNT